MANKKTKATCRQVAFLLCSVYNEAPLMIIVGTLQNLVYTVRILAWLQIDT